MANDRSMIIQVDSLREEIREPVKAIAQKLLSEVGDNFESFTVVGSSLTGDFDPKKSDINTVLVVGHRNHRLLKIIVGYGKEMSKKHMDVPLIMTREYIEQSLDVFGMEFLDYQLTHQTVAGADPFADLTFQKANVRLQCERELKSALIQLRQGYIRFLGNHKYVGPMLADCTKKLVVVMRTMLWLVNVERSREFQPTIETAVKQFEIPITGRNVLMTLRQEKGLPAADLMDPMFEEVYQVTDHLAKLADKMKV